VGYDKMFPKNINASPLEVFIPHGGFCIFGFFSLNFKDSPVHAMDLPEG
jgi:hypothetical protein